MANPGDEWAAGEIPEEPGIMIGSQATLDTPVQALDTPQQRALSAYGVYGSWRQVAAHWRLSVATVIRVARGYEPRRADLRAALGLPPRATVDLAPGVAITSGAILITSSRVCPCGQVFIPNHPSRMHCPSCRPPRKCERKSHGS
jgi:ribosomal protein S27AE